MPFTRFSLGNVKTAVSFLEGLKYPKGDGWYYSVGASQQGADMMETPDQNSGRYAVCGLASHLWGTKPLKDRQKELDRVMALFMAHRKFLWEMRTLGMNGGKVPDACGAGSTYDYFAFFGYHYAGQALREVSAKQAKDWALQLRQDLLAVRDEDGTWNHIGRETTGTPRSKALGYTDNVPPASKTYGTAVALIVLKACQDAEKTK